MPLLENPIVIAVLGVGAVYAMLMCFWEEATKTGKPRKTAWYMALGLVLIPLLLFWSKGCSLWMQ